MTQKTQTDSAPAVTWSLVASLDPTHVEASRSVLTFYGAYAFTPLLVNFNPTVIDTSINQSVVPQYAVPVEGGPRTYKVVYHLATDVTTTTSYRFNDRAPVTVPGGVADVEIIETPQHTSWNSWALRNANNDHWLWYSVKIYEQISRAQPRVTERAQPHPIPAKQKQPRRHLASHHDVGNREARAASGPGGADRVCGEQRHCQP